MGRPHGKGEGTLRPGGETRETVRGAAGYRTHLDELERSAGAHHDGEDRRKRGDTTCVADDGYALEGGHRQEVHVRQLRELFEQDLRREVPP